MGFGSEDSRAAEPRVCQEQGAIDVQWKKLVSMPRVKVFSLKDDGGWDDCGTGHVTIDYLEVHPPKNLNAFPSLNSETTAGGTIPVLPMEYIGTTSAHDIALAVIAEENNKTMLLHLITSEEVYKKEDTFITWCDPDAGMTLCLSFQDAARCSNVWDVMCQVRKEQELHPWSAGDTDGRPGSSICRWH